VNGLFNRVAADEAATRFAVKHFNRVASRHAAARGGLAAGRSPHRLHHLKGTSVQYHLLLAITALVTAPASLATAQLEAGTPSPVLQIRSPDGRFEVQFSQPRTAATESDSGLWSVITVRDLRTGNQRTAHVAEGDRGSQDPWQGFRPYEGEGAWSPDNLYVAYLSCGCMDQEGVPEFDAVCHNDIRFLPMLPPPSNRRELALSVIEFGGWTSGRPHTVFEIDAALSNGSRHRRLPYVAGHALSP
jgi:hypothetical protein